MRFYSNDPVRDAEDWLRCQDEDERKHRVGYCDHCGEIIYGYEEYYDFNGEIIHADCLYAWAEKFRKGESV